jgi:hypothetical protein
VPVGGTDGQVLAKINSTDYNTQWVTRLSGTGAAGQITYWTNASVQSGSNNLFWDNTNARLGLGINTGLAARLHVVGAGTATTWTAQFLNSASFNSLRINDDGTVYMEGRLKFGGINTQASVYGSGTLNQENLNVISGLNPGTAGVDINLSNGQGDPIITSSIRTLVGASRGFAPTSGSGEYRMFAISPTINQTGGASGASIGFLANPTLTSAASWRSFEFRNNSGWGVYGVGTAPSYFAGDVRIGTLLATGGSNLAMARPITGGGTVHGVSLFATINSDVGFALGYATSLSTSATTFSTRIRHFSASQGTFGAGSTVTEQSGFEVSSTLTGATANYAFVGGIPSGTDRWNAYMSGTAQNYFAGNVLIGTTTNAVNSKLFIKGAGSTSSSFPLFISNSLDAQLFMVRDDGAIRLCSTSTGFTIFPYATDPAVPSTAARNLSINWAVTTQGAPFGLLNLSGVAATATSSDTAILGVSKGYTVSSGSGNYAGILINPPVDQSATATGAVRMIYVNPTVTAQVNLRVLEWSNNSGFGLYGVGTCTNYLAGNLGLRTTSPTDLIDINGVNGYSQLRLRASYTPTSSADTNGNIGDIAWDDNFLYVKVSTGWKKSALTTI